MQGHRTDSAVELAAVRKLVPPRRTAAAVGPTIVAFGLAAGIAWADVPNVGKTVLLSPQTQASGCTLGPNPDRQCSPGAYYSGLTKSVICSPSFRTSTVRHVPVSEKHQV